METNIANTYTEVCVDEGGEWLTESYPTNFHHFYKRKMLTESENATDYMEVTEAEKAALETSDAAWVRPPQSFIDYARALGMIYNEGTGYFELNGLLLSYEEALKVVLTGITEYPSPKPMTKSVRTNIFIETPGYNGTFQTSLANLCAYASALEVVRVSADDSFVWCSSLINTFWGCSSLREVLGVIDVYSVTNLNQTFNNVPLLETIFLKRLKCSINLSVLKSIGLPSLQYLIRNSANTSANTGAITITLHAEAFGRLTPELIAKAAERQITFASA